MKDSPIFKSPRINILLIIDITLLVYLTLLVSGFSSLDDTGLMESLQNGVLTFSSIAPDGGATYLRPLTILTYLIDYQIWGANPVAFHITSLVIHTANASLVYWLCRSFLAKSDSREGISLFAALLFAVTPLNSEPVLWVSGRTDLLCCLFFLLALLLLINDRLPPLPTTLAFFTVYFCSLMAKESSIALLGIVPIYLFFCANGKTLKVRLALCSTTLLATAIYFFMRLGNSGKMDTGAAKIISEITVQTPIDLIFKSIAAIGFYLKKLIWPFPLNLAIHSINEPIYFLVGIVAIIALVTCLVRYSTFRLPLLIISISLVPPLLAFHGGFPWTLYAERYLYLPMTGMALLAGLLLVNLHRIPAALPFLLIIPLAVSTIHRSGEWADPLLLWHDTIVKSPDFPLGRVIYSYELIQAGRFVEAKENIAIVRAMKFENELLRKCIAAIKDQEGGSTHNSMVKGVACR